MNKYLIKTLVQEDGATIPPVPTSQQDKADYRIGSTIPPKK
jgi:hypothetical protein